MANHAFIAGSRYLFMRRYLSLFLAVMFSLNAAYMASVGVCAALENLTGHSGHFGHHSHDYGDAHNQDDQLASADEPGKTTPAGDHQHSHVHPGFFTILPDSIAIVPLTDDSTVVAIHTVTFISAPQTLLERPPKAPLA